MNIQIYGIQMFSNVTNWFASGYAFLLFAILTLAVGYAFFKLNFTEYEDDVNATHHYLLNTTLFAFYACILFWISKYVLQMDIIMSVIFTFLIYSASIFILTMAMIFMRRNKLKKFVIKSVNWMNNNPDVKWIADSRNAIYRIRAKCIEADHKYTDMLLADIDGTTQFKVTEYYGDDEREQKLAQGNRPIDLNKYTSINIWENKNMNPNVQTSVDEDDGN